MNEEVIFIIGMKELSHSVAASLGFKDAATVAYWGRDIYALLLRSCGRFWRLCASSPPIMRTTGRRKPIPSGRIS